MKTKNFTKLAILTLASTACLSTSELSAWESKPVNYSKCRKDGKSDERCQKENREDNLYTFGAELSTDSFTTFNDFTDDQKNKAMSLADGNKMSPDDAVAKVQAGM
jgi:hypothetical protein